MAKYSPVAPIHVLEALHERDALGDYFLLLAHDVANYAGRYHRLFKRIRERADIKVIMDNSLVELGEPVSGDTMRIACTAVQSDIIVLPDAFGDTFNTLRLSRKGIYDYTPALELHHETRYGVVLQGQSFMELETLIEEYDPKRIVGMWLIPRCLEGLPGFAVEGKAGRYHIAQKLAQLSPAPVHLLGFSDDLISDQAAATSRYVSGIDSAVPIRMAYDGATVEDLVQLNCYREPRGDYWEREPDEWEVEWMIKNLQDTNALFEG